MNGLVYKWRRSKQMLSFHRIFFNLLDFTVSLSCRDCHSETPWSHSSNQPGGTYCQVRDFLLRTIYTLKMWCANAKVANQVPTNPVKTLVIPISNRNPILRTYTMFKTEFGSEKYTEAISDCRYRIAMTKLRSSSHTLEVERGRYTNPKTNICERLCPVCNVIEDEIHFLANCKLYDAERTHFFGKVTAKIQNLHLTTQINSFYWCQARTNKF